MKTFHEVRQDVLRDIEAETELSAKEIKYSFAQIEELAAKEYAKIWVDEAAEIAMMQTEKGLPVGDAIYALKNQIDEQ